MISSILVFLVVLSILILVHELGHFVAARKAGIWVEEFGFGLPPRLFGKKIGETIYSLNLLPFGGFVRLHGENTEEGITKPKRAFLNRNKRTRSLIVVAGVVMNFLLAVFCFALVYSFSGIPQLTEDVKVVDVAPSSPAQTAGVVVGDIVRKIGETEITSMDQFVEESGKLKGKKIVLEIEKEEDGEKILIKKTLTPREEYPEGEGPVGITISTTEIYFPPIWQRPFIGIYRGFKDAIFWGVTVITGLVRIVTGLVAGDVPKDIAGPVGIFAITSEAAKFGILALVNFIGILSVNLVILNIIPFPALDGGRLFFIGLESVLGKKVMPKVESVVHTIGMVILILLLFAITAHDIRKLISNGGIAGYLDSFVK